jgi:hypothetical protein
VGRQKAPASSPHLSEKRDLGLIVDDQTEIPEPLTEFCQLGAKSTLLGVVNLEKPDYDQKVLSSNLGGRKSSPRGKRLAILTSKTGKNSRDTAGILPLKF